MSDVENYDITTTALLSHHGCQESVSFDDGGCNSSFANHTTEACSGRNRKGCRIAGVIGVVAWDFGGVQDLQFGGR